MRISGVIVDSFKRVDHIEIAPDADRFLILIGGKNANGKTSFLDALTAAFGGKDALPADPVRHGADEAEILVELDDGAITIRRLIKPNGESSLEIRDPGGKLRGPQGILDKLVGQRFLDPLAFLALPAAKQRAVLLELIDRDGKIAKLDARRVVAFDRRTEVGRDHRKATGELERIPAVTPAPPIDVDALTAEMRTHAEQQRVGEQARSALEAAEAKATHAQSTLAAARKRAEELEAELVTQYETINALEAPAAVADVAHVEAKRKLDAAVATWRASTARREQLDADVKRASAHNQEAYAAQAQVKRRAEVAVEVAKHAAAVDTLTAELAKIDADKAAILTAAALPVEGLGVDADGLRFHTAPLAQASGAEQLRVALALAIASAPNLRDVWVRDGALLDDDSLAVLAAEAKRQGVRVWLERVGDRDPGAIVIHNGRLRDEPHLKSV